MGLHFIVFEELFNLKPLLGIFQNCNNDKIFIFCNFVYRNIQFEVIYKFIELNFPNFDIWCAF